jgi:hypothetical protein
VKEKVMTRRIKVKKNIKINLASRAKKILPSDDNPSRKTCIEMDKARKHQIPVILVEMPTAVKIDNDN